MRRNIFLKKVLIFLLAVFFIFSLVSCTQNTQENISNNYINEENTNSDDISSFNNIINETVLFEKNGIKVTAKELFKLSDLTWGLKLLIENDTEENIGVQCNSASINSYMVSEFFSCTAQAKNNTEETLYFSSQSLETAQISTISSVIMSFHVFNRDNYTTLFDTEEVELRTSLYNEELNSPEEYGTVLYEKDGIRILIQDLDEKSLWGKTLLLLIENDYGEDITVRCENMLINGYNITPFLSCTVNNGRKAYDEITIMSRDLEKQNIDKIEKIDFIFRIINPKTYETITETETVTYYAD